MLKLKSLSVGKFENKAIENRFSKVFQKTAERENRFKSIISFRSLKDKLKLLMLLNMTL